MICLANVVAAPATLPFRENFEGADLASYWSMSGTGFPRVQITNAHSPHHGLHHAVLDSSANAYSRTELTLRINLAGATNVLLSFWAKYLNFEPHGPPPFPFYYGADFDGVAVSGDGITWYEVQSLRHQPTV